MTRSAVSTARLDAETLALVDRVSSAPGRSRSSFAADAIEQAVKAEAAYLAFVQEGIDAADRGDLIPHDHVFRDIRARRAPPQTS